MRYVLRARRHDLFVSNIRHNTNQQLEVLTFVSAVLLPMTAIAGSFGMSFQVRAFTEQLSWIFHAAPAWRG